MKAIELIGADKNNYRLASIDALRGLCAVLVILQHALPKTWLLCGIFANDPTFYVDLGRIGVAAFFLVSGYVIPFSIKSNEDQRIVKFWIRRFFRLWPIYWLAIALALLLNVEGSESLTFKQIALNFTMLQQFFGQPNVLGVFWTLQIELCFYLSVTAMIVFRIETSARWNIVAVAVLGLLALVLGTARLVMHLKFPVAMPVGLLLMFLGARIRMWRIG